MTNALLELARDEPTTFQSCPRGLVVCKGRLQLKTADGCFDLKTGELEFLVLPEEPATPVTAGALRKA